MLFNFMTGDDEEILVRVSEPCAMNSTLHTTSYPVVLFYRNRFPL